MIPPTILSGSCLCKSVRYNILGTTRHVVNCHCETCRKLHGSFGAYISTDLGNVDITKDEGLTRFLSTNTIEKRIERSFCNRCGTSLFWRVTGSGKISISAGSLDQPSQLQTISHIWTSEKADFYQITDNLTQHAQGLPKIT